ncbi:hypothetical protein GCM10022290_02370 [Sagittula marina]
MGFLSVIRRLALRDKMPVREIARRTGLSRNTIKKYLREGAVEPKFKTPKRPSKLAPTRIGCQPDFDPDAEVTQKVADNEANAC